MVGESVIGLDQIGRDLWLLDVGGEHDAATAPEFDQRLTRFDGSGMDLVIDLSRATFIDSSIVGVLVKHTKNPAEGDSYAIVVPEDGFPRRVLNLLGLETMLPVCATREEALQTLAR